VFRWNDGEEAGHGNEISGDDGLMADCVIMCFFSMVRSIWFFSVYLSVYLSFCLFVILFICHSVSFGFYGGAPGG
jgi:hypothetical protein